MVLATPQQRVGLQYYEPFGTVRCQGSPGLNVCRSIRAAAPIEQFFQHLPPSPPAPPLLVPLATRRALLPSRAATRPPSAEAAPHRRRRAARVRDNVPARSAAGAPGAGPPRRPAAAYEYTRYIGQHANRANFRFAPSNNLWILSVNPVRLSKSCSR